MPSMHRVSSDILVHTQCILTQTMYRHDADYDTSVHLVHWLLLITHCDLVFTGPTWLNRDGSVLVASRRFDWSRSPKTKGSLADTLQCNIWRRAQKPHRMTHSLHGGQNRGIFAIFIFEALWRALAGGCEHGLLDPGGFGQRLEVCRVLAHSTAWCWNGGRAKTGQTRGFVAPSLQCLPVHKVCFKSAESANSTLDAHF